MSYVRLRCDSDVGYSWDKVKEIMERCKRDIKRIQCWISDSFILTLDKQGKMEFNEKELKIEELNHRSFVKALLWGAHKLVKESAQEV